MTLENQFEAQLYVNLLLAGKFSVRPQPHWREASTARRSGASRRL